MQDYKLKPCPFCGGYAHLDKAYSYFRDAVIYCEGCDIVFTLDDGDADTKKIVETWNRRAPGWVSVDKVLPLNRMHVIGFDTESKWDYPLLYFRPDTKEFLDETYDYKPVSITHWMPYPEAPKEESDNE